MLPTYNYVCAGCIRHATAARSLPIRSYTSVPSFASVPSRTLPKPSSPQTPLSQHAYSTTARHGPFRLAIIGSGPAGFYTAHKLMKSVQNATVDMYEQLPVPYGLVRFGVAPDHPEVKNCENTFEEVAASERFNYIGNVKVGQHLHLRDMKPHYDAILFSYGASEDRKLGIPGEDLPGVYSARDFVGWYNGLPEFRDLNPDLQSGDQAVVIGQGNVALDVARILLTPVDTLRKTDISTHALETLSASKIKSVNIVGRRGPMQASFTNKEARELMNIPDVSFAPVDRSLFPSELKKLPRVQRRIAETIVKGTQTTPDDTSKSWALTFLHAPKSMHSDTTTNRIANIEFTKGVFSPDSDPYAKDARVSATTETMMLPASVAFRSIGYKSAPLPGLSDIGVSFNEKLGMIHADSWGRVQTPPSSSPEVISNDGAPAHVHGLYCAGWVKRGPTGVILSTMADAFESADVIAADWQRGQPFLNTTSDGAQSTGLGWDGVKDAIIESGTRPVSWADWKRIDAVEREKGKALGKEREKFVSVEDMLRVLDG
ncbi:unnamed protein product [Periconia digitata]|uniref:NADPH:adrenodoxin oxidoreductase, mitochondrial n=1 Tax=Periconia digitata TaxID=1303443 RepID=A0A9W4XJY7_9PLEO|nr:unnamed protein product [Periconia digitata]